MNNFEKKCCEENEMVKSFFDEGMVFEAWIIIIRETNLKDGQALFDEVEKVVHRKCAMTDDEKETLDYEFFSCRSCGD